MELQFYKLPIRQLGKYGQWQYDANGNFVYQFEPYFVDRSFDPEFLKIKQKIVDSLNSAEHEPIEGEWEVKSGIDLYYNGRHLITIRGWGNLTGCGAKNFSAEKAALIQDNFIAWFLWKVGNKPFEILPEKKFDMFVYDTVPTKQSLINEIKQIVRPFTTTFNTFDAPITIRNKDLLLIDMKVEHDVLMIRFCDAETGKFQPQNECIIENMSKPIVTKLLNYVRKRKTQN